MKHRGVWTVIITIACVILVTVAVAVALIYSGFYNVAADQPHSAFTEWMLSTTSDHSIARRASGISTAPLGKADLKTGADHHREMCVTCHGGPGVERSVIGDGLNPQPPDLQKSGDLTAAEVYWIVHHGIKMTGMPSFGVTHTEAQLWDMVAFVKKLPEMTPEQYRQFTAEQGGKSESQPAEHEHHHD